VLLGEAVEDVDQLGELFARSGSPFETPSVTQLST
jgi:hypothetical protein